MIATARSIVGSFIIVAAVHLSTGCSGGSTGGGKVSDAGEIDEADDSGVRRGMTSAMTSDSGIALDNRSPTGDGGQVTGDGGQARDTGAVVDAVRPTDLSKIDVVVESTSACLLRAYADLTERDTICPTGAIGRRCGGVIWRGECGFHGGLLYGTCSKGDPISPTPDAGVPARCCLGCVDSRGLCRAGNEKSACGSVGVDCQACPGTCGRKAGYSYPQFECQ